MPTELPTAEKEQDMQDMRNVKVINIGQSQTPINFMDGLALLLIGLKLTDHLDNWTWVEVLAPLWAPFMVHWFVKLVVQTFFTHDEDEE
jgi:hypothetical protein